jgi:hypothetical protein
MESTKNLWPSNLRDSSYDKNEDTPRQILLQQANFLSELKKNVLEGEVRTSQGSLNNQPTFVQEFIIKAPTLGKFHFTLLRAAHGFDIYPVSIYNALRESNSNAKDETEFKTILKDIFQDSKTINAIKVLEDSAGFNDEPI